MMCENNNTINSKAPSIDFVYSEYLQGRYLVNAFPIDNNAAERAVRCMTTARNNSFHFGSDLGAQMSATYHSIISTAKLHGSSVWNYLGKFFTKIFEGCRDYSSLMPSCIGLE